MYEVCIFNLINKQNKELKMKEEKINNESIKNKKTTKKRTYNKNSGYWAVIDNERKTRNPWE